jgi:hypothetical protein
MAHDLMIICQISMYDDRINIGPFQGFDTSAKNDKPEKVAKALFRAD